jgi:hypothetical protein
MSMDSLLATDVAAIASGAAMRSGGARHTVLTDPWTLDELLTWWRDRNHRDPLQRSELDWGDAVERVALACHFSSWNSPEEVRSLLTTPSSARPARTSGPPYAPPCGSSSAAGRRSYFSW